MMTNFTPTTAYTAGLLQAVIALGGEVLRDDFDFTQEQAAEWASKTLMSLNQQVQTMPQRDTDEMVS